MLRYINSKIALNMFCITHLITKFPSMQSLSVKLFHMLAIYQLNLTSLFSFFQNVIVISFLSIFSLFIPVFVCFPYFLVFIISFIVSFHSFISFIGSPFLSIRIFAFLSYFYLFPFSFIAVSLSFCQHTKPPAVSNNIFSVKFLPLFPFHYCVMSKLCSFFPGPSLLDLQLLFASIGFIKP